MRVATHQQRHTLLHIRGVLGLPDVVAEPPRVYAFACPHGGKTIPIGRSTGMLRNLELGTAKSGTGKAGSNSNDSGPGARPPLTARSFASIRAVDAIQDT